MRVFKATPILLAGIILILLTPAFAASQSRGRTWAIVVGVSRYPEFPLSCQLQFAERDALSFSRALVELGVPRANIRTLIGRQATLSSLRSALATWLSRSASPQDTVYLFFSGNGVVETEYRESYLLCSDSNPRDLYSSSLSLAELKHILASRVKAERVVVFADAVRQGLLDKKWSPTGSKVFVESFDQLVSSRPGVAVVLANGPGEISREGQQWGGYGVFTRLLVRAVTGEADLDLDGRVSYEETYGFVAQRVAAETSNEQHPWRVNAQVAQLVLFEPRKSGARPNQTARVSSPSKPPLSGSAARSKPVNTSSVPNRRPPSKRNTEASTNRRRPPRTPKVATGRPSATSAPPAKRIESDGESAGAPLPILTPPSLSIIAANPVYAAISPPAKLWLSETEPAPSPLPILLEVAVRSGLLIGPPNTSAWGLYQQLVKEESGFAELARLRSLLSDALITQGKAIVLGDVRVDRIGKNLDDLHRANELLSRARSLQPGNQTVQLLEQLNATHFAIALRSYDEAKSALLRLQGAKVAAVENALGLVYLGEFDDWRAERSFKRAIEIAPEWAAPHYNLAMIYKNAKKDECLTEFEQAARLDPANPALLAAVGDEYFARENWAPAAEWYRKAVSAAPNEGALHTKLGHALYSLGLRDDANREYKRALELRDKRP